MRSFIIRWSSCADTLRSAKTEIVGQLEPGHIVSGKYTIKKKLGQGGFGATYLAEHPVLGLKVIKELLERSKKGLELFQKEASVLSKLRLDGVPRVTDYFEENGKLILVEDFIDGRSLREILRDRKKLALMEADYLLRKILSIVRDLHENKAIHRDIKPDNIMVSGELLAGKVYLIDFGGVKEASQEALDGKTGTVLSSKGYTAPEQLLGKIGFESDIYSLGMTIAECVTGIHAADLRDDLADIDLSKFGLDDGNLSSLLISMTHSARVKRTQSANECIKLLNSQSVLRDKDRKKSDDARKENIREGDVIDGKIFAAGLYWDTEVVKLNWYEAMEYATRKGMRLPTKEELIKGYVSRIYSLRKPAGYYWSSTPSGSYAAWHLHFPTGTFSGNDKNIEYLVRCVSLKT